MKKYELMALPYAPDALEPVISKETIGFHHSKHLQAYVDNLNKLLDFEDTVKKYKNYQGNDKGKADELIRVAKSKNAAVMMCLFDFDWHARRNPDDNIINRLKGMAMNAYSEAISKL